MVLGTVVKEQVPWAMVWLRVVLCPVIVFGAHAGWDGRWLGLIVLIALVDDIYDGVLARHWGSATEALRRADSAADTVFYLGVAAALWMREEQLMRGNWKLLAGLGVAELVRHGFDRWKFGRAASYHSYMAKLWGLVMGVAVISVLSVAGPRWLVWVSLMIGIACDVEGFAMSVMLPRWQHDVKTLAAAWRLQRQMLACNREDGRRG